MSTYDAPDLQAMVGRMFRALARRAGRGELEALEALNVLSADVELQLQAAVAGYRAGPARASWDDIGRALGITRQSAWERFRAADELWAHPPKCQCAGAGHCHARGRVYVVIGDL